MKCSPESPAYLLSISWLGVPFVVWVAWLLLNIGPLSPSIHLRLMLMLLEAHFSVISSVTRDWREELVFACSKKVNTTLPFQAEAEAIKWALSLASNLNFEAVIVESDFQICANLRSDLEFASPCYIKSIISDSLALLADSLSVSVYWVPRQCNYASPSLARWSFFFFEKKLDGLSTVIFLVPLMSTIPPLVLFFLWGARQAGLCCLVFS